MMDLRTDAAKRLQIARENAGFRSAKAAADRFHWNYETYAQHENGNRGITRAAKRYATAFRVSEGWLLTGDGEPGATDEAREAAELNAIFRSLPAEPRRLLLDAAKVLRRLAEGTGRD